MKVRKIDIPMPFTREEIVNSREYKISSAALNDISNIDEEYADNEDYIGGYVDGFENGAKWADEHPNPGLKKEWLDKACKWLRRTQPQVILPDTTIERFRNAMEEQQ